VPVVVLHLQVRLVPGEAEALVPGDEGGIDGPVSTELAVLDGEHVEGEPGLDVTQRDVETVVELAALDRDARRRRARRLVWDRGQASHNRWVREQVELLLIDLLGAAHACERNGRDQRGTGDPHALLGTDGHHTSPPDCRGGSAGGTAGRQRCHAPYARPA